jgi:hypothetical protein
MTLFTVYNSIDENAKQERRNGTGRKGQADRAGKTGQAEQDWKKRLPRQDCMEKTTRTGLPGHECRDRAARYRDARTGLPG